MGREYPTRTTEPLQSGDWEAVEHKTEPAEHGLSSEGVSSQPLSVTLIETAHGLVKPEDVSDEDKKRYEELGKAQRKALMHWTLFDFKVLLETHGIDTVMEAMPEDTYWLLYSYFNKD